MEGTWFVLPTAFDVAGRIDLEGQRRLTETVLGWDVDGLVTMGVTSEATALTDDERDAVVRVVVEATSGRAPVVVGCSASSVEVVVARTQAAGEAGAAAVMVSAPPATSDVDGLPRFYERVADAAPPTVVQDEPAATGTTIPVDVLVRCADAAGSTAVKLEDPPTPPKIRRLLEQRPDLDVFGGLGGMFALDELRSGARGTMTGFAFPEILAALRTRLGEDAASAARVFDRYLPLIAFEAQQRIGLAIRKEVLRRRGALPHAVTRVGPVLDARTLEDLDDVLERVGIRPSPERFEVEAT